MRADRAAAATTAARSRAPSSLPDAAVPSASRYQRSVPSYRAASFRRMSRLCSNGTPLSASATSRRTAGDGSPASRRASASTDGLHLAQRPERGEPDLRIGIGELPLHFANAGRSELARAARSHARDGTGCASASIFFTAGSAAAPAGLQPLEPAPRTLTAGLSSAWICPAVVVRSMAGVRQLPALGRDAIDAAVAAAVVHLMAADDRIEPVGDVDRAVRADRDVARPEPLAAILIDLVPDVVRVRRGEARQEVESLEREPRATAASAESRTRRCGRRRRSTACRDIGCPSRSLS